MLLLPHETNFCVGLILSSMKDMEWVLPNPLVDMTVEDLATLRCQLKNVAKNQADLFLHEWPSALDITNELHRLQEALNEYSLNQIWFSTHARVDGTVMMIMTPEIRRVSRMMFDNVTTTLWMIVMHSVHFRKFCVLSLEVLIMPILNMRQTVWIWYPYQAITKQAPGFPLTMGMNSLKVNYKLGREVAAEMSVVGFEAPVLNPQTRKKKHEEDAGADDM
jgi:hypothetical protein